MDMQWYVQDQIILLNLSGNLNYSDLKNLDQSLIKLFNQTPATKVHLLINAEGLISSPGIAHYQLIRCFRHPKLGQIAQFGDVNQPSVFFRSILSTYYRRDYQIFVTERQAMSFIQGRDASIQVPAALHA